VANTNVVNHAGRTLALVESSLPYEITNKLETLGVYDFGGKLVDSMTAHPKISPELASYILSAMEPDQPICHLPPHEHVGGTDH